MTTIETLFIHGIHTQSLRYDKIWGERTAYSLDVNRGRAEFLLVPGNIQLIKGQQIHIVRWGPRSQTVVAMLQGGYATPIHIEPMSWFSLSWLAVLNNGMGLFFYTIADSIAPLLIGGLGLAAVNLWLIHDVRARLKLKKALAALHKVHRTGPPMRRIDDPGSSASPGR